MHGENFENIGRQIKEKLNLFKDVDVLIYCKDHIEIDEEISNSDLKKTFSWSTGSEGNLNNISSETDSLSTAITANYQEKESYRVIQGGFIS